MQYDKREETIIYRVIIIVTHVLFSFRYIEKSFINNFQSSSVSNCF